MPGVGPPGPFGIGWRRVGRAAVRSRVVSQPSDLAFGCSPLSSGGDRAGCGAFAPGRGGGPRPVHGRQRTPDLAAGQAAEAVWRCRHCRARFGQEPGLVRRPRVRRPEGNGRPVPFRSAACPSGIALSPAGLDRLRPPCRIEARWAAGLCPTAETIRTRSGAAEPGRRPVPPSPARADWDEAQGPRSRTTHGAASGS